MELDRHDVFKQMVHYYIENHTIMDPFHFQDQFEGKLTTKEAIAGISMFDNLLDLEKRVKRGSCIK